MQYDYSQLQDEIKALTKKHSSIEYFSIGKSVMEREIPCLKIGLGEKKLLLSGAYHGLEYLTSAFLIKFLSNAADKFESSDEYYGYDIKSLLKKVTLYIVPMVNPDGVDIAVNGLDITNPHHRKLISDVGIHSFNSVWQANSRGVDINHNFNADWQMVVERPSPSKYGGANAESEPETQAIVNFVREMNFDMLLAFHSQGKEIYYDFNGMTGERSLELAEKMALESGYKVCCPTGTAAFGGCKDWFIKEFGREGFTIEIGTGKNPLALEQLNDIYEDNARIVLCTMNEM